MIHEEHGLIVFIDMQPSEQLGVDKSCVGVMCGVFASSSFISNLKQYKNTPKDERILRVDDIANEMTERQLRGIGCVAHFESIEKFGNEMLDTMPEKVAEKIGKQFKFDSIRIGENVAKVMPWYAVGLSAIALKSAPYAQRLNLKKVLLLLDKLPGNSSDSLMFLRRMNNHPKIFPEWEECEKKYDLKFTIANMESFQNMAGEMDIPNNHPEIIYADWLAHSIFAAANCVSLLDKPANRDEEYRSKIASIFLELHKNKLVTLLPLEDLRLS